MKVLHPSTDILQRYDEAHEEKPLKAKPDIPTRSDESAPSEPTAASSEPPSNDSNRGTELSRTIGDTIKRRIQSFEFSSCLPKDDSRPVAEFRWKDLNVGDLLGCGGFSSVHSVSIRRPCASAAHNDTFAVKMLHKKLWSQGTDRLSYAAADLAFEAKLLSRLNHENIIQLHGTTAGCPSTAFDFDGPGFFLVLGLLEETLHMRLRRWRIDEHDNLLDRLETAALGIAKGMEYLHDNNIVFRDLKSRNVGFDKKTGRATVFDFGLAAEVRPGEQLKATVGTFRYMAPETILGDGYGYPCDVYSFGVLLWQIVALPKHQFAYKCKSRHDLLEWVFKRGGRPSLKNVACPKRINRLIKECWHPDPQFRPTFKSIHQRLEKIIANPGPQEPAIS